MGPGIAPATTAPVMQIIRPGIAPLAAPLPPPVPQMLGPGVAPAATLTPSDTNMTQSISWASLKELSLRKYTYTMPLKPGVGLSAK